MADGKPPGPLCRTRRPLQIKDGTLCLQASPTPGAVGLNSSTSMTAIARMSSGEKLGAAIMRARHHLGPEVGDKLLALVTPEALAIIGATAVLWAAGHAVGVSWFVDGVLIGAGVYALGNEALTAARDLSIFVQLALAAKTPADLDKAGRHFARFVATVGVDTAIALLLRKTVGQKGKGKAGLTAGPQLRPDVVLGGAGRSGQNVKFLTGPAHSAVKSAGPGRIFVTNAQGQVILDITAARVKPVTPGVGFGDKRLPTPEELELIKRVWGN
jgi:hypothetical protein